MVLPMLMKRPEHKKFDYRPRYYNPDKDKQQNLKDRMNIARRAYTIRKKNNKIFLYFLIVVLVIYLAIKFGVL